MKIKNSKGIKLILIFLVCTFFFGICAFAQENRVVIGQETTNGSLDCVDFFDADGNALAGAEITLTGKTIDVSLPADYDVSGKVKAVFTLTQNADGLPYVSPKNGASGTSKNKAWDQRTNTYTSTLSGGSASQTVYFYNLIPKATTNKYDTYTINYKMANEIPAISDGVEKEVSHNLVSGEEYIVNLDEIFTDADGDTLSYSVTMNDVIQPCESIYTFRPELGGEYILVFSATDGKASSTDTYTVTITVSNSEITYDAVVFVPEGVEVSFFVTSGYDEYEYDLYSDELEKEKGNAENGFISYTVKVPQNIKTISIREQSGGGMSFEVSENCLVYFRYVDIFIPTQMMGEYLTEEQVNVEVADKNGKKASFSETHSDDDGCLCFRFLLAATGNDALYTFYANPIGNVTEIYNISKADNKAIFADSAEVYETAIELNFKSAFKLNVPGDAEAKLFYQNKNYKTNELSPLQIIDEEDGTKTYFFHYSSNDDAYSFRVYSDGKITKAGFVGGKELKVEWDEDDYSPTSRVEYDKTSLFGSRGDDSLLLNVNSENRLTMAVGDTFRLRAYRIWQIINNDTMNKMIEPDFTYEIISGDDVVSITAETGGNCNAKNNLLNIEAIGEGIAIIEIGYDALDIVSGNVSGFNGLSKFVFGACDENRKNLLVVQTKDKASDIDFGIVSKEKWDYEFDTLYFTEEYGTLDFIPTVSEGSISKVECSNDKGQTFCEIFENDGKYSAKIISGNNILKVTKDDGTYGFQVVRGDKISTEIVNVTSPDEDIKGGDTVRIILDGVHFPMGKMSGLYNPGYRFGHKLSYTFGNETVQTEGTYQYDFPANAFVDVKIPDDAADGDKFVLSDGYIYFNNMGGAAGSHRNIPEDGIGTNMGASTVYYSRCILPDITIAVGAEKDDDDNNDNNDNNDDDTDGDDNDDDDNNDGGNQYVPEENKPIDTQNLVFDISGKEIKGYVTVSFYDNGERNKNENGVIYKSPLGQIIEEVKVPFKNRDTVASVTLRLLKALGIEASYTGSGINNFYLSSIGDFTLNGVYYESFGEFDAGASSGWMVKHNGWFINMGASEFKVSDGDTVEWLYTCNLGADIGCDWNEQSAEIIGIEFSQNFGKLSPKFSKETLEYSYTVSQSIDYICLEALLSNYWAKVTYTSDGKTYKAMDEIPVIDGTQIIIESVFNAYDENGDSDKVVINIKKKDTSIGDFVATEPIEEEVEKTTEEEIKDEAKEETPKETVNFTKDTFHDVKETDWFYEYVSYVYENGLMTGTDKGFEPELQMTRAMFVTVLYRMSDKTIAEKEMSFSDVSANDWFYDAVLWAYQNGIVNGRSENEFDPYGFVTREETALIFYRFAKMQEIDVNTSSDISHFEDAQEVSPWALDAVKFAYAVGIINGKTDSTLCPNSASSRAELSAILTRFSKVSKSVVKNDD